MQSRTSLAAEGIASINTASVAPNLRSMCSARKEPRASAASSGTVITRSLLGLCTSSRRSAHLTLWFGSRLRSQGDLPVLPDLHLRTRRQARWQDLRQYDAPRLTMPGRVSSCALSDQSPPQSMLCSEANAKRRARVPLG